jgi:exopolysaccharide production protein ExoQ
MADIQSSFSRRDAVFLFMFAGCLILAAISARTFAFMPGLVALGFLLANWRAGVIPVYPDKKILTLFAGLAGLAVISCVWSVDPARAFHHVTRLPMVMFGGLVFLTAMLTVRLETVRRYGWLPAAALLIGVVILKVHQLTDQEVFRLIYGLPDDARVLPYVLNRAAAIITFCLIPALLLLKNSIITTLQRRLLGGVLLMIYLWFMALCDNQSSQLAVLVMAVIFFVFPARHVFMWRVLMALLVMGLVTAPLIALTLYHPFAEAGTEYDVMRAASVAQRLEIWHFISLKIIENPITGFGYEAARLIPHFTTDQTYFGDDKVLHPHNAALQLWLEFGVFGAAWGVVFIILMMQRIKNIGDSVSQRAALAMFCGIFTVALIGWGVWQAWLVASFFIAAGLMVLAVRIQTVPRV